MRLGSLVKTIIFCPRNQLTVIILIYFEVVWMINDLYFLFVCFFLNFIYFFNREDEVAMG